MFIKEDSYKSGMGKDCDNPHVFPSELII